MPVPSSGPLSFSVIAGVLGVSPAFSLHSMSVTAGKSIPHSVSEFYGYSSGCPPYGTYIGSACYNSGCGWYGWFSYLYYQYADGYCSYYYNYGGCCY